MLAVCLPAGGAAAFTNVYFFGDSLSDTGNACSGLELHPGYTSGRCSNGPVWTDQLAAALGFEAVPSSQLGNNFANGGDTTEDLLSQIGVFSLFVLGAGSADPEALYVVWLGGNDVLDMPAAADAMQQAVDRIVLGIETLRELGAREFLVPNLPDVGRTFGSFAFPQGSGPAFTPAERDRVTELSLDFNARLEPALDTIPGVTIHRLDVLALLEEVFSDPAAFGLLPAAFDTTSDDTAFGVPCLADSECAADPQGPIANGFLLFDAIHPTTAMHAEIGRRATMAVPEPSAALLQVLGLCGAFALARRRAIGRRTRGRNLLDAPGVQALEVRVRRKPASTRRRPWRSVRRSTPPLASPPAAIRWRHLGRSARDRAQGFGEPRGTWASK